MTEYAWLIEKQLGQAWWIAATPSGKHVYWTTNANEAVRFARKEDAERMIPVLIPDYPAAAIATQHAWDKPT
jgi:hypothetical protein